MRHLRKQFHEYFLIRRIAVLVVLAPTLFVFIDMVTGPEDGALRRRMLVVLNIFITGLMFWIPIYKPVWAFIVKDEVGSRCLTVLDAFVCCTQIARIIGGIHEFWRRLFHHLGWS